MSNSEKDLVVGIDLGTTFSAIAKWERGKPSIYQNSMGGDTTQSVVHRNPTNGQMLVGAQAFRKGLVDPENVVIGVKRLMDDNAKPILLGGVQFTPVEISAEILKRVMADACQKVPGSRPLCSVVTVPYYFKVHQCENTRKAAELANIKCRAILQEPIAASLAYAWKLVKDRPDEKGEEMILVFDLGGGTFDLTLFRLQYDKAKLLFEVLAIGGDDRMGGMDFDERLMDVVLKRATPPIRLESLDEKTRKRAHFKLLDDLIQTKIALSQAESWPVTLGDVVPGHHIADIDVTREDFEECIKDYVEKIDSILTDLFADAGHKMQDVTRVILVGGSSQIPAMRSLLERKFGRNKIWADVNVSHAVAEGAAMYAAYLDDPEVFKRTIEIKTRSCHALGLEVSGGLFHTLVPANKATPCAMVQTFSRDSDGMTELEISVYQGAAKMARDNSHIGTVQIKGLKPKPRDTADVKVTFKVSVEQMLSVVVEVDGKSVDGHFDVS